MDNTNGKIDNKGTIIVKSGQVKNLPDTVKGRVEFTSDYISSDTKIPNIVFYQLILSGKTRKWVDSLSGKPLVTRDSFVVRNQALLEVSKNEVNAQASVFNSAVIKGIKHVRLINEDNSQNIEGIGQFANLNIDNPYGVDIVKGGGFRIDARLELTRGEMRNDPANNFTMGDSSLIVRHAGGSIKNDPQFEKNVSVLYTGTGAITQGPEAPKDSSVLLDMTVENTEGVTLSRSITVNRQLSMTSPIFTEPDDTTLYTLTLNSVLNPVFAGDDAEIWGSIRRKKLLLDSSVLLFNNAYTYAIFADTASAGGLAELTFRVKPRTFPPFNGGDRKVRRFISVTGRDLADKPVQFGLSMTMGYGWRNSANMTKDESNSLTIDKLILQRWVDPKWFDHKNSYKPQVDNTREWAYSSTQNVSALGDFAIGLPGGADIFLNARVFLEGPYRFGSMALDLNRKNLIPNQPPDIYPYNLDPKRGQLVLGSVPDSVVDWILLEFRNAITGSTRNYVTCFVRPDGRIVDIDGRSRILLSNGGIDTGEYYIVIRHRNHLAIITEDPIKIYPETADQFLDFTKPELVLGRYNSLKAVDHVNSSILFAMIAGDVDANFLIDDRDRGTSWSNNDFEGYSIFDINMSGIVNTRDLNYIWNNKNKSSSVP